MSPPDALGSEFPNSACTPADRCGVPSAEPRLPKSDDGDLLARIAGADRTAGRDGLAVLYERHAGAVLGFLERALGRRTEAEDLLHDSFLAAARRADTFRGRDARGWLMTLAANRLRDRLREERRRERREQAASRAETLRPVERSEGLEGLALDAALARLAPAHRAVIDLRHVQGLPHLEVARTLGVSLRTAKQRSRDALVRLREILESDR